MGRYSRIVSISCRDETFPFELELLRFLAAEQSKHWGRKLVSALEKVQLEHEEIPDKVSTGLSNQLSSSRRRATYSQRTLVRCSATIC